MSGLGILRNLAVSILRHPLTLLSILVLGGALAFLVVKKRFGPTYRAEALLQVAPIQPHLLYTGEEWRANSIIGYYNSYLRTLTNLAGSPRVIEDAVAALDERQIPWRPDGVLPEEAGNHLAARIDVGSVRDTHLLHVTYDDPNPNLVAPVVNAITESFLMSIDAQEDAKREARIQSMSAEAARLKEDLTRNNRALDQLTEEMGGVPSKERENVFYDRLVALNHGLSSVQVDRVIAQGQLEDAIGRADELKQTTPWGEITREVDQDPTVADVRLAYSRTVREVEIATGQLAAEHPRRAEGLERIQAALAEVKRTEELTLKRIVERTKRERQELAKSVVSQASRKEEAALASEEQMMSVLSRAKKDLQAYERAMYRGAQLQMESQRLLSAIRDMDQRVEELRIESRAPGRITVVSRGRKPGKPAKDRSSLFLLVGLGASFVGALAGVYAKQRFLGRIKSQLDLRTPCSKRLGNREDSLNSVATELLLALGPPTSQQALLLLPADSASQSFAAEIGREIHDTGRSTGSHSLVILHGTEQPEALEAGKAVRPVRGNSELQRSLTSREFMGDLGKLTQDSTRTCLVAPSGLGPAALGSLLKFCSRVAIVCIEQESRVADHARLADLLDAHDAECLGTAVLPAFQLAGASRSDA